EDGAPEAREAAVDEMGGGRQVVEERVDRHVAWAEAAREARDLGPPGTGLAPRERLVDGPGRHEDPVEVIAPRGAEPREGRLGPLQVGHRRLLDDGEPGEVLERAEVAGAEPGRLHPPPDARRPPPGVADERPNPRLLVAPARPGAHRLALPVVVTAKTIGTA